MYLIHNQLNPLNSWRWNGTWKLKSI